MIQSLFPYKIYTNIKKHQNNKETKYYGGKDRKAHKAWWLAIPEEKKKWLQNIKITTGQSPTRQEDQTKDSAGKKETIYNLR